MSDDRKTGNSVIYRKLGELKKLPGNPRSIKKADMEMYRLNEGLQARALLALKMAAKRNIMVSYTEPPAIKMQ